MLSVSLRRGAWPMRITRLLSSVRFSTNFNVATASSTSSSLRLNSYFEPSVRDLVYSINRKIDGLIKSGDLNTALKLFDEMPVYDVVTYNMLISGHGRHGFPEQAFHFYAEMVSQGIRESASTFSSVLGVCNDAGFCREGMQVHCRVVSLGFGLNLYVGGSLVDLYLHMGLDNVALKLFDELPYRNVAVWNLLLRGFCELGRLDELCGVFSTMEFDGVDPNGLTYCYLIRGCSNGRLLDEGKQLHCRVVKDGWVESNVFVANALVDLYSACGSLIDATEAFEAIQMEDVISWNSIIWVCAENGLLLDALKLFVEMQFWEKRPSIRSFIGFLNLASRTENIELGKQMHSYVLKSGFGHGGSVHVQSALIDMYGKCVDIESSVSIYESVGEKTLESCNSLMTSLLHCGVIEDVVEMFGLMVDKGIGLDEVTLSTTLKALSISALASSGSCKLVHCCAIKSGFGSDIAVSCSLIDAYARCGHVKLSRQVFEQLPSPNVICFTSIIHGYARNGMGSEGLDLLQEMISMGLKPDQVTILGVLSGCNHSGLVKEARFVFDSMKKLYDISPDRKHFSCMVDLLGRAGMLEEAEDLLQQAPVNGDCVMWSSLLRSCRIHKNETVGRRTVKTLLLELDVEDPEIWLQASNFYSEIGEFDTAMQIREIAIARKVKWEMGHSLIETSMDNLFAVFVFGMLIAVFGVARDVVCDNMSMLHELESFNIEEDNELNVFDIPTWKSERGSKTLVNVDSFGAAGDGVSDDTQAFQKAWGIACNTTKAVFLVPQGRRYLVNATKFQGPCADNLIIQIEGTIVAPDEPNNWDPNFPRTWLDFTKLNGVLFQGHGVIDGSGSKWWAASCKTNKTNPCRGAPTAFTIDKSSAINVKGITIKNAQQMNFVISQCDAVRVNAVQVSAPGDSPNTDGIHITASTNVILQDCKIGTGDDCVSIVNGTSGIKMKRIFCGPGHGISIGSLGKDNSTAIVTKVVLDTAYLRETTNGLRIKTWQGGAGYVRGVCFQNVKMENVSNPIIIDQFYCDSPKTCQNLTSAVQITQVMYKNIYGTTKSAKAMKFACSDTVPCRNIVLTDVNLEKEDGQVETYCNSAQGFGYGIVHPSAECLNSHDKETSEAELADLTTADIVHTEL
ncbi:hypothetical protein ACFX11_021448 [Malus domestica]